MIPESLRPFTPLEEDRILPKQKKGGERNYWQGKENVQAER